MRRYEQLIYNIIYREPRHLTTEDIFHEAKAIEPKIVLATVYNNLNVLHEKGLIHKVIVDGMPDRYDGIHRHDHLVCCQCGQLVDIAFKDLTAELEDHLGIKIQGYELNVSYLCPDCQNKK